MEYKFKLNRIHCAGCALALEQNLNSIEGVSASISFVTKVLILNITTDKPAETLTEVKIAITKFDHMIEILPYEDEFDEARKTKKERNIKIVRYLLVALLIVINFFIPNFWVKLSFFIVAYLVASYDVLISAFLGVIHGKVFDESLLMSVASIGAFIIGEYFEAVCVMFLYGIGEILEDVAVSHSKRTIKNLLEIKQHYANLVGEDGEETQVALEEVSVGDTIRIKPGERIPLDSVVLEGTSYLDMSALTGETKEKIVSIGDEVLSGAINGSSVLLVKVQKLEKDSTVSKIIDLVQNATETKAKSEKFISKFSKIYTPTVIGLALFIMFIPPIFSGYRDFANYAYRALSFLVVSCPCALVISVPLTYFAGIGAQARIGVMIKGANFLETLSKVDSIVFDKTGTLTEGNFEISEIYAVGEHTEDEILEVVAYAESYSNHKIAKSVMKKYKESYAGKEINSAWINGYEEVAGKGIKANIFMQDVLVGNAKLLKENDISFLEVNKPGTTLYVSIGDEFAGYIVISDMIKKDARLAIQKLKALGINDISISTGDEDNVTKSVSEKISVNNYYSGLLPEDKLDIITDKVQSGKTVAFIGDGINDAPSLANANVGISMGGFGSDIAVESSDVVIMTDEPSKVADAIKKAKKTHKIVLENIIGSISIKVIILALLGFGLAGMWLAVFADVGVCLLAIINSLRVLIN